MVEPLPTPLIVLPHTTRYFIWEGEEGMAWGFVICERQRSIEGLRFVSVVIKGIGKIIHYLLY